MANKDIEHYSYCIEFQVRGLPHLHDVFWLKESALKGCKNEDGEFSEKVAELIDKWISCSLETGDKKSNMLVKEVHTHHHTNSCKRGENGCRFNFPRLSSDEAMIVNPLDEGELEKEFGEVLGKEK